MIGPDQSKIANLLQHETEHEEPLAVSLLADGLERDAGVGLGDQQRTPFHFGTPKGDRILKETKTPGAAIAIVTSNQVEWLAGIGKADVAVDLPVTPDTLFRLGSVSKGFVALAASQLQEAGKLKLTDTVRQWVPDVAFVNPWEVTNPVRLVHLMEHTSGFDDMHLREYALNDPAMTLNAALAYGASSRVCRWPPGTRLAYCNSGPAVVA